MTTTPPRKGRAAGILAMLSCAALAVTACSTDSESDAAGDNRDSGSSLVPEGEGTTEYPLTLTSDFGESVLEEQPQRIAVFGGLGQVESTVALGVSPVTVPNDPESPWAWLLPYQDQLTDAEWVSPWEDQLPVEQLAAADPDLIIATSHSNIADDYDQLASIAPVLTVSDEDALAEKDWQQITLDIGEALDLGDSAQELVDKTASYIDAQSTEFPQFEDKTVSILINRGDAVGIEFINTPDSYTTHLLSQLGFAEQPNAEQLSQNRGDVSLENLSLVDADGIMVANHGGRSSAEAAEEWLQSSEMFQRLTAVQEEHVTYENPDPDTGALDLAWAFSHPNILSVPWTIDQLSTAFAGIFD